MINRLEFSIDIKANKTIIWKALERIKKNYR